jgi:hypothetical protein
MSLNGDTFNALKTDFDQMLRKLLSGMEKFECEEATLNIKVGVKLEKDQARDFEVHEYEAMRDIVKPTFKHEISSAMQVKDKKTGSLSGNYELVWDRDSGQYVMRNIDDGQVTLFDTEGSNVIQMPEPPALPAGTVIDADYRELEEGGEQGESEDAGAQQDVSGGHKKPGDSPFDYLRQFVGADMKVMGTEQEIYTIRSNGKVILSSGFSATDRFYCSADKLAPHVGHAIVCEEWPNSVVIRCDECDETLFEVVAEEGEEDDSADYPYEEPGEELGDE